MTDPSMKLQRHSTRQVPPQSSRLEQIEEELKSIGGSGVKGMRNNPASKTTQLDKNHLQLNQALKEKSNSVEEEEDELESDDSNIEEEPEEEDEDEASSSGASALKECITDRQQANSKQ